MSVLLNARDLGPYLKQKREDAGFTQAEVSKALGLTTPQFVSNWERGLAKPPMNKLVKLIKMYRLDASEVIEICMASMDKQLRKQLGIRKK